MASSVSSAILVKYDEAESQAFATVLENDHVRQLAGIYEFCIASVSLTYKKSISRFAYICSDLVQHFEGNCTGRVERKPVPLMKVFLHNKVGQRELVNNPVPCFFEISNTDRLTFSLREESTDEVIKDVEFSLLVYYKKLT